MPRGGRSRKKNPGCNISAVTRYLTAIIVYDPRGHKVLPSCLLTCLLITKGHPAGTQCWPLNAKGYSIKTRVRGKEEVIRRAEGMTIESYRLKKKSSSPNLLLHFFHVALKQQPKAANDSNLKVSQSFLLLPQIRCLGVDMGQGECL